MKEFDDFRLPPIGLGLCSVVMGAIGLVLFIVPIIGLPISGAGIIAGMAGIGAALCKQRVSLRLSVAGLLLSISSFGTIWTINLAAGGYFAPHSVFPIIETPRRPYIPPPAPPRSSLDLPRRSPPQWSHAKVLFSTEAPSQSSICNLSEPLPVGGNVALHLPPLRNIRVNIPRSFLFC